LLHKDQTANRRLLCYTDENRFITMSWSAQANNFGWCTCTFEDTQVGSELTMVSKNSGSREEVSIFWLDLRDNRVHEMYNTAGHHWSIRVHAFKDDARPDSAPVAVHDGYTTSVFVVAQDGQIYESWLNEGTQFQWHNHRVTSNPIAKPLSHQTTNYSAPVLYTSGRTRSLFFINADLYLEEFYANESTRHQWTRNESVAEMRLRLCRDLGMSALQDGYTKSFFCGCPSGTEIMELWAKEGSHHHWQQLPYSFKEGFTKQFVSCDLSWIVHGSNKRTWSGGGIGQDIAIAKKSEAFLRYPPKQLEGWGCSLAWCGKVLGSTPAAEAWADLLFTTKDVEIQRLWPDRDKNALPRTIPGLGLKVVRYNIGGSGRLRISRVSFVRASPVAGMSKSRASVRARMAHMIGIVTRVRGAFYLWISKIASCFQTCRPYGMAPLSAFSV
jgi:hypothetical protein